MNDILSENDHQRIVVSVVRQAGPDGITEDELLRRAELLADHVRNWKVSAGMYDLYRKGQVEIELTPDESDVKLRMVTA